jgi:energy-coupling factor transporter ATP-binding protein EcfA2
MITTIIEKYLSSVDQATFQKMMNHLLHLEGYRFIGSPGAVIGKNKTSKGSPDSFFEDGDNFIFCEYTTQERLSTGETFFKKLKSDIDHCFDVKSTKIEKSKLSKVILAFTEEVNAKEFNELKEQVKKHNPITQLVIYSIQEIPFRLVYYPGLADKYISGVKTTKGTLYTLPDFLKTTEKGLQPSLTNPFTGREDEIKHAKDFLQLNDILIITGSQGVGKSKLAVHLADIFENEFHYEPRVIASSPVPLWEDLTNFILPTNKYFIFFDDANKSLPNLDYLLQFINGRDKNSTKIVITVRDYVRSDLDKFLLNVPHNEITVRPFEDQQISQIVNKSLHEDTSLDPIVLERIVTLSKGNSRLALMATSSILQNNDISILNNVFSLYDQYFQKVKSELSFLENPQNLKALGILSFFNVLDRNNEEIKEILERHFNFNWNELWEIFIELEKVELVDVFYREAAKISDQVLSTYVFYKTFIDEALAPINYSDWLVSFIEKYDKKINKTLVDLLNTFGFEELKDRITSLISDVQKKLESDNNNLYKFFEIFWFYREVDTLLFVKKWINNLNAEEPELLNIKYAYEVNDFVWAPEYFKLLLNFWNHNTSFTKEAIELGLKLMFRQPSRIPETLKHLKENLAFHRFDYRYGYPRQLTLIDVLDSKEFSIREKVIADQLFLSIAPSFLGWEYSQIEGKGGGQMMIYNFALIKTPSLMELRKRILMRLFSLFDKNEYKVIAVIHKYAWTSRSIDSRIYADEQQMITDFLCNNLKVEIYSHCKLVYKYVNTLKSHNVDPIYDWNSFLNSDSMGIAKIFSSMFDNEKLKFEEQEQKQREEIKNFISGKDIVFITKTFEQLDSIYKDAAQSKDTYWIDNSLVYLFQSLSESDSPLYYKSLELIMLGKYAFDLNYGNIIFYPIRKRLVDPKEIYKLLNRYEYKQKQLWKQMFFEAIEEVDIDEFFLQEFIGFIFSVRNNFGIYGLDKYIKFDKQFNLSKLLLPPLAESHNNIISFITEILLSKTVDVDVTFDRQICEKCISYFSDQLDLLKRVFYLHKNRDSHYDYDGKEMEAISSLDHNFLIDYLIETTKDVSFIEFKFDSLNLTFIWNFPEYEAILDNALEIIIAKAPIYSNFEHQANVLFKGLKLNEDQLEMVYNYISKFISKHSTSLQHIHIILNVVTYNFNNQVLRFLREFLSLNKNIDFMNCLWLEKNEAISGSRVPTIEAHISFLKSMIEMAKTLSRPLDYSEHIKLWEQEIEWAKKEKQAEMKRDFTGWFD